MGRIMPEVALETSHWVIKNLAERGAEIHLDTQLLTAADGVVKLSDGTEFGTELIVWTAGVMANPVLRNTDFPLDERGRLQLRPDLRVEGEQGIVEGAWGAGDATACPDLSGGGVGGFCVPNAQHAVRQAKVLAKNIVAVLRGEGPTDYFHKNLGAVAGLGLNVGVFQSGKIALTGYIAWLAHRGYHGMAMPSFERKFRVVGGWWNNFWLGRDIASLRTVQYPRQFFEAFATRQAPAPAAAKPAAARKPAAKPATAKKPAAAKKPAVKAPPARKPAAK
jgi:NADH dehydrogenase